MKTTSEDASTRPAYGLDDLVSQNLVSQNLALVIAKGLITTIGELSEDIANHLENYVVIRMAYDDLFAISSQPPQKESIIDPNGGTMKRIGNLVNGCEGTFVGGVFKKYEQSINAATSSHNIDEYKSDLEEIYKELEAAGIPRPYAEMEYINRFLRERVRALEDSINRYVSSDKFN